MKHPKSSNRLLFVAHREEILKQSIDCFRGVLRDANFGDLLVGKHEPDSIDHLFISVQSFNSRRLYDITTDDFYDFIVIDEFHHAAAPTYDRLLTYYNPKILLGLTATPERMDGKNVVEYFDNRIAAEIRLPEAIDKKLLSPFQYFGITDSVDLNSLKWTRGGYDKTELSNLYSLDMKIAQKRASMVINSIIKYVTDINEVKGLGFCVSVEHAKFMANYFNEKGIHAIYLVGTSPDELRNKAKSDLSRGKVRFVFVVDIYNEGVDIPEVNTVLFLRPTESLTVFLQQLGRGLRLSEGKECLTVLDFIGQANAKYNFEDKFGALLFNTSKSVQKEIKDGFVSVPKGCYIQLERKAKDYILNNIKSSFSVRSGLISRISTFEDDTGKPISLKNFLEYYHLDILYIYGKYNFSRLCVIANVMEDFHEEMESDMTKAFAKICAIDSRRWIEFLLKILSDAEEFQLESLSKIEIRMLEMFHYTVWQRSVEECGFKTTLEGIKKIKDSPVIFSELLEILNYNYDRIDFIDEEVNLGFDCPLDLHCRYTRDQILISMDFMKPNSVREGVKYLPDKKVDILFVTLNKSEKDYSPTTMYNDYSINETLFHWQSQSTTRAETQTGQRYINHNRLGSSVVIFVRENRKDLAGTAPYTYLGLADYVEHTGSRPMSIMWKLHRPIPSRYLNKTNKLVMG